MTAYIRLAIGALALALLVTGALVLPGSHYEIASWALPQSRTVRILADRSYETNQLFHYEVMESGNTVVQATPIDYFWAGTSMDFFLKSSKDGSIVGIFEAAKPEVPLAVHNFGTGESWPKSSHEDGSERQTHWLSLRELWLSQLE